MSAHAPGSGAQAVDLGSCLQGPTLCGACMQTVAAEKQPKQPPLNCHKLVQEQVSRTHRTSRCNISPSNMAHLLTTRSISAPIQCSPGSAELQEQALSILRLSNKGPGLRFPRTQLQLQIGGVPDRPAQVLLPTKGC